MPLIWYIGSFLVLWRLRRIDCYFGLFLNLMLFYIVGPVVWLAAMAFSQIDFEYAGVLEFSIIIILLTLVLPRKSLSKQMNSEAENMHPNLYFVLVTACCQYLTWNMSMGGFGVLFVILAHFYYPLMILYLLRRTGNNNIIIHMINLTLLVLSPWRSTFFFILIAYFIFLAIKTNLRLRFNFRTLLVVFMLVLTISLIFFLLTIRKFGAENVEVSAAGFLYNIGIRSNSLRENHLVNLFLNDGGRILGGMTIIESFQQLVPSFIFDSGANGEYFLHEYPVEIGIMGLSSSEFTSWGINFIAESFANYGFSTVGVLESLIVVFGFLVLPYFLMIFFRDGFKRIWVLYMIFELFRIVNFSYYLSEVIFSFIFLYSVQIFRQLSNAKREFKPV